jgi:hypothetical protein
MHQHEWVVVDVDDAGLRGDRLSDLMRVVGGRQAAADVEELADPRLAGQVSDHAGEESPGGTSDLDDLRVYLPNLISYLAIDGEVVLAAQPVVPDSRPVRDRGVDLRAGRGFSHRGTAFRRELGRWRHRLSTGNKYQPITMKV